MSGKAAAVAALLRLKEPKLSLTLSSGAINTITTAAAAAAFFSGESLSFFRYRFRQKGSPGSSIDSIRYLGY